MVHPRKVVGLLMLFGCVLSAGTEQGLQVVTGEGQAEIRNGQLDQARELALSWARWDAVAHKLGIIVKSSTLTNNSAVAEDICLSEVQGVVRVSNIVSEQRRGDVLYVKIEAIVDEYTAQKKVEQMIRNTSLVVLLPAAMAGRTMPQNPVSELLIQKLTQREYTVIDETAVAKGLSVRDLENLMSSSTVAMRSAAMRFLSNIAIIGKIEGRSTVRPGDDVPFAGRANYFVVRATASYRIVSLSGGGLAGGQIVSSGTTDATGMGNTEAIAFDNAVQSLSVSAATEIAARYERYFEVARHAIEIRIQGNIDLQAHAQMKQLISQIKWTRNLRDLGIGHFSVDYDEKPVYLAYSFEQKPGFKVVSFNDHLIEIVAR